MAHLASPQSFFDVSGGDPIYINGSLVLCGRSDNAAERFFNGKIAQFAVFDNALTPQMVCLPNYDICVFLQI